ncbi:hypothetical protein [Bacillus pacificus]|uniref:hypothetical protein n=1 Tax=Bacillus pacificus TaxID=2026187 RepID=UPI0021CFF2E6|nr:hypothetical protein [Bacillus pacificus]MCU5068332.1 hypothetical protein [Bacillus pacificus]
MIIEMLCCSSCYEEVRLEEEVTLDIMNTITHRNCEPTNFLIKDIGTFQEIANKYAFLTDQVNFFDKGF